ncbi:MAG TPA: hypothetical protein VJ323_05065, partial [Bryobacteraceae bacterium]|nr:hypothetical protein [Bryobacteraceae bacterium]
PAVAEEIPSSVPVLTHVRLVVTIITSSLVTGCYISRIVLSRIDAIPHREPKVDPRFPSLTCRLLQSALGE